MAQVLESEPTEEQVEQMAEQQAEAAEAASKHVWNAAVAERARARQLLELKRERILSEKTNHPVRRSALQAALKEIEAELQQLA